jgi:hypothetical protein
MRRVSSSRASSSRGSDRQFPTVLGSSSSGKGSVTAALSWGASERSCQARTAPEIPSKRTTSTDQPRGDRGGGKEGQTRRLRVALVSGVRGSGLTGSLAFRQESLGRDKQGSWGFARNQRPAQRAPRPEQTTPTVRQIIHRSRSSDQFEM